MFVLSLFLILILLITNSTGTRAGGNLVCQQEDKRTLFVSATGELSVKPDVAIITFDSQSQHKSATEAYKLNQAKMRAILSAIKSDGLNLDTKDMQTRGLSLQPVYIYSKQEQKQVFAHYKVEQELEVKIRDMDKVSNVLDAAVFAGSGVKNVNFTVENMNDAKEKASKLAYQLIKKKAESIAISTEIKLGKPITINDHGGSLTTSSFHQPRHMNMRMKSEAMAFDESMPVGGTSTIESGEIKISHAIDITYELI
jgi:uncharacterized protein